MNLVVFDVPRLSVDIDLNCVGAVSRDTMLDERLRPTEALQAVFSRAGFGVRRAPPDGHAGGKWSLRYPAASGQSGRIDVDVNYMCRDPPRPIATMESRSLGSRQATDVPVLDTHELAAGKLVALLDRRKARDLFDSSLIFSMTGLDNEMLRTFFVVYGAMEREGTSGRFLLKTRPSIQTNSPVNSYPLSELSVPRVSTRPSMEIDS